MPGIGTVAKRLSGPVGVAMDVLESEPVAANEEALIKATMKSEVLDKIKHIPPNKITASAVTKVIEKAGIGGVDAEDLLDDIMVGATVSGDEGFDIAKKLAVKSGAETSVLKKPKTMGEIPLEDSSYMKKLGGLIKRNPVKSVLGGFAGFALLNAFFKTDWSKEEKSEAASNIEVDPADKPYSMEELELLRDKSFGVEDPVIKSIERLQKILRRKRK